MSSTSSLYVDLLGSVWHELDAEVQRFHRGTIHASGHFCVRRGTNWLARLLANVTRLPTAGDAVPVDLFVTVEGDTEEWRRSFAARPLISKQSKGPDGVLVERMQMMETRFRLQASEGALSYHTMSASLCIGRMRIPIPRWLRPNATALERRGGKGKQVHVSVSVELPVVGLLISYEGNLTLEELGEQP